MKKMIIRGGRPLKGTVSAGGSKNATLPIMAAALLSDSPSTISGIPMVRDIRTMSELFCILGANSYIDSNMMHVQPNTINNFKAPYELVKTMRASIYVLGPLLGKYGRAKVSMPGGCAIGLRPIDLHLLAMKKLGAKIEIKHGYVEAVAKKLRGARIVFPKVSLGATVNATLAAVLAEGKTVLENASKEPEVYDTINFLKAMGAKIEGSGTGTLEITGVRKLNGVTSYTVIPDRIEAATLIAAAVMTKGRVTVNNVNTAHLSLFLDKLKEAGAAVTACNGLVRVAPHKGRLTATGIHTEPYPGFPTDIQAQWMALMSTAAGDSIIKENIWENRFMHVPELGRMGADITIDGNTAVVRGVKKLSGASVMASDLRASAALIIAGLSAGGETEIRRIYHLERGYEALDEKLRSLGASVDILPEDGL
ncbi:MAG: UDP-N-acetylglucosamine 1-carboxyvinyltransferase [Spirochaetia bacterium]|nr:UDP-N-acetylglucosamine 1-carboxyvinyltransferase [Spirochaetia bacterium]